jgi:hypothetical protein
MINNKDPEYLPTSIRKLFHTMVAKLLFVSKWAQPDIMTAVAFLCTGAKTPDNDEYKKLGKVMRYLRGTPNIGVTRQCDGGPIIKWWMDASFACHSNMQSHTGGIMTLGKRHYIAPVRNKS